MVINLICLNKKEFLMINPTKTMFLIKSNKLNKRYKEWITTLPCVVPDCKWTERTDPHHASIQDDTKGISTKVPDYYCIPLCLYHHRQLHDMGIQSFAYKYALNYEVLIIRHLSLYIITFGEIDGEEKKAESDKDIFF